MNTDKIYAEQLANEYAPKDTSKVVALRKLDARAKLPATIFAYTFGIIAALITGVGMWRRNNNYVCLGRYYRYYWTMLHRCKLSNLQEATEKRQTKICQ